MRHLSNMVHFTFHWCELEIFGRHKTLPVFYGKVIDSHLGKQNGIDLALEFNAALVSFTARQRYYHDFWNDLIVPFTIDRTVFITYLPYTVQ